MNKLERIYLLDSILKQRRTPIGVAALKERLDCSQATVYRIIGTLRDEFNAPVESNEQGVYYRKDAAFDLPGIRLSAEETQGLLMAAHLLEDLASDSLQKPMHRILENIDKVLAQKGIASRRLIQIIPALSRQPNPVIFQTVMGALQTEKKLHISYLARNQQQVTERLVSPQRLTSYKNAWYLDAWCHLREGIRLFALEQIQQANIDIERAHKVSSAELRSHYADSYGIFSGPMKSTAVIKINTQQAPWTVYEHWHSKQQLERLDEEHMLLKVPYNHHQELLGDVLRLGTAAEIVAPDELKKHLLNTLNQMLQQHQS